jgi:hypothetical protein
MTRSTGSERIARAAAVGAVLLALGLPLGALASARAGGSEAAPPAAPSFARDVAPIVREKCTGCHRLGGIGPFPLETAKQISSRAELVEAAVRDRRMPPWPPGPRSPAYVDERDRRLSSRERATILAWARAGARVDGPALGRKPVAPAPPRAGETELRLRMPRTYRPNAPSGVTDDYRCFLLDPKLGGDAAVTSARIEPGATEVVHHVILFRAGAAQVPEARRLDAAGRGLGWSCFGGTGLSAGSTPRSIQDSLDDASWIAAWAPGWGAGRMPEGTGVSLPAGSQVVMQVHYNLLHGRAADRSQVVLTTATAPAGLAPLRTMLLPAPVELACAKGERARLCSRNEALFDLTRKYGPGAAFVPAGLLVLCRGTASSPTPTPVSTCDRRLTAPTTIRVAAGHMHLLGASIRLVLNPGTPRARVLLDIPRWDFHWQNAYALAKPVRAAPGDVVRVTCRHDAGKRHRGEGGIPRAPRYVLWGEGTTDEMCLGILQVTRD